MVNIIFSTIKWTGNGTLISNKAKNKDDALKFLSQYKNNLRLASESKVIFTDLKSFSFDYQKFSEKFHTANNII